VDCALLLMEGRPVAEDSASPVARRKAE